MYTAYCKLGWDKTCRKRCYSLADAEAYLNKMYRRYLPSQIVATWIVPN